MITNGVAVHETSPSKAVGRPLYIGSLQREVQRLKSADGGVIEVWRLAVPEDEATLKDWARRFRENYCPDSEIDQRRAGTGLSRADYLTELVFPSVSKKPGPSVRAGDFAELLVSDYVQYVLGYWVPRVKYADKTNPNESIKGVDVVGFSVGDSSRPQPGDRLLLFEVKARLSYAPRDKPLQRAVNDSGGDFMRLAYTLNKVKQLHQTRGDQAGRATVERFQNKADRPFELAFGAAAVVSEASYDTASVESTTAARHSHKESLSLLVIRGGDLMKLAHSLYQRAADEA